MANGIFTLKQQQSANADGTWVLASKTPSVNYLVVAGGGGAGNNGGGGGGAGGVLEGVAPITAGSAYTVTVGTGGATSPSSGVPGNNGGASVFGAISTDGGGGGGYGAPASAGASGGSGGGSAAYSSGTSSASGGAGVTGQGNKGGDASFSSGFCCAGGGGAATVGLNALNPITFGGGGAGIASAIGGPVTAYGGGGGGYNGAVTGAPPGGAGGGGAGGNGGSGANGSANTGGGGGGNGGSGGSGIVILSYPDIYPAPASTTGSPTASTSGSGSILFNGSSYLSSANNAAFKPGTGDFTIEAWVYPTSSANQMLLIDVRDSGGALPWFWSLGTPASIPPYFYDGTTSFTASNAIPINTWTHYAVSRTGTTIKVFLNGVQEVVGTCAVNLTASAIQTIGGNQFSGSVGFSGYLSNFRFVKGTGLYTGNFTPSTVPLTAITNTTFLLNTVSGAPLVDSSVSGIVQSVSGTTPTWNQLSPFATGSGYKNRVYTWTGNGSITF